MKKFCLRLFLFAFPVLIVIMIPVYVLLASGESFTGIDKTISANDKYLIGYAYHEDNYRYLKWKTMISREQRDVVVLGSSRVLQFRENMFDSSFYNAGYTIYSINDFIPFLKSIPPQKLPRYLIIGLDQWMFNATWDNLEGRVSSDNWTKSFKKIPGAETLNNVWKDLLSGKYNLALPQARDTTKRIGLNAVVNNNGFRNDGSMQYGIQVEKLLSDDSTAHDYGFHDTYDRISKGDRRFEYGEKVNPKALAELDSLLSYCKTQRIEVIAFIPPFADKVNEKLAASGRYKYMDSVYPLSLEVFRRYGFDLYDFGSLKSCNSGDTEVLDGFHAGELAYLKILIRMLEANSVLNRVTNLNRLRQNVLHPVNRYTVYEE